MSDVPRGLTTGEVIRHLRERRGLTRPVLAGLVGYSADWLERIEAGQRGVSIPALLRLARILQVSDLSVFLDGDRPLPISVWEGTDHPAAMAMREIAGLLTFAPIDRSRPPDLRVLTGELETAWRDWHTKADNRSAVARVLPELIRSLEQATMVLEDVERRSAYAALASAYGLAQHLAVDMVEPEIGRVTADLAASGTGRGRSGEFGVRRLDLRARAAECRRGCRLRIVSEAATELARHMEGDSDAIGLFGSLNLHMAISAAHQGQSGVAWGFWDKASEAAKRLPATCVHPQTVFGSANVTIHGASLAAELRRAGEAMSRVEGIDPGAVLSRERRGRLFGEMAAGHLQRREYDAALRYLDRSYTTSPEMAPYSPLTRGVAVDLLRNAKGPLKAEAVAVAGRIGVIPVD